MKILVTGATGKVGRPLVDALLAGGHAVRALTRDRRRANLPAGVEVVAGDLGGTESLNEVFVGVAAVHLITFHGDDFAPLANGEEIVALAQRAGVRRVTVLKGDVTRSPLELAIAASGLEWTFLAPVEFMSNTLEWAEAIRTDGVVREGFAAMKSALIHEADIAAVAATALTTDGHAGREYLLTGPQALTPPERLQILEKVLGRPLRFVELRRDEIVGRWRAAGFGDSDVEFFLKMRTEPPAAGYTVLPTVERVTGRPARTFARWVQEHAAAFGGVVS
ncbi:NmrA family NAD(P)-binding protein [Nannocystis sp. SCPEA4]|uniref:NmrA family NAD(P)-binding protein n=1 Tax=Nannocystis sp. SCPEA4 TaxID=2996787 RepID=UPI00226F2848|nr:NmrA family NAD(P)-binding protein [Nannocystis sp. SCPEA4]MCY1060791.1 NmrA family NAD(P)-binding protein [Nannocystis sp. SCPEA4]